MNRLHVSSTKVHGCVVIKAKAFEDERGNFFESYNNDEFSKLNLPNYWAQDNISTSRKNVLRGMHIQSRNPQGKLVRCLNGAIVDVCLDLRRGSPSFMMWHSELLMDPKVALYCPPGTAHGFLAMKDFSVVYYKCTTLYDQESDGGVNALSCGIKWPIDEGLIRSTKDLYLPNYDQWFAKLKSEEY